MLELREVLEYWSQIGTVDGTLEGRSFGYQNFKKKGRSMGKGCDQPLGPA